ncbi:MAG: hypothetical protein R3321_07780 [Nitrososphaeraceae archaeon]|nr:hypothetical protein [Nitrososphaeraceae archaeon]
MKQSHKEYFKLNKIILVGFAASIIISAIVAQIFASQEAFLNTTITVLVDYGVFFSVLGGWYYFELRKKYKLLSGKTDKSQIKNDLIKIITSLGIAEVVYTIARWIFQFYFLTIDYDPYLASIVAQSISTVVYFIVVNLSVKITRLYKDAN